MKKTFLALVIFIAVLGMAFPVFANTPNETCGDNLTWEYDTETKTLTISGTGAMSNFDENSMGMIAPWRKLTDFDADLEKVEISEGVTSIGDNAFYTCSKLESINVDKANATYYSENGVLYNKKTELIRFPKEKTDTSFTIPNSVTKIADGAFENCQYLKTVTIPDGVTSIGDNSFNACENLTGIIIPNGVPSLGEKTFCDCESLTSVTIPNSVISIWENAFLNCDKLKKVNYIGSTEEWNAIEKGNGYYSIADALITYCSGISAIRSDEKIVVRTINIDIGKTVILALYNGDRFIGLQTEVYYGNEIKFIPTKAYTCAKIMIWNNLNSMSPVCGAYTVK